VTRPRLVDQPIQTVLGKPVAPPGDHRPADGQLLGDVGVLQALRGQQHDPRALRQALRTRPPPRPRLQLLALLVAARDRQRGIARHEHLHAPLQPINASRH
jgi:hypothetical protein